jgi:phosphoribosylaminoimidazolecarboxamide formyltransferase/IMP cyclohydrolase
MIPSEYKIKRAIISVSDKTGIVEFAQQLAAMGVEIFSTGGTQSALASAGVAVKSISEITSFPEILDGRLKTLHPLIHGGLLAELDKNEHIEQTTQHDIKSIDLVVVNLYPFEATLERGATHAEIVENIDIGGPTMLRSAAKNYKWTAPVVNPERYSEIIDMLKQNDMTLSEEYRVTLAGEVFQHTSHYDSFISGYFNRFNGIDFPEIYGLPLRVAQKLRYGENPHQKAMLYGKFLKIFEQLHGKELSYNNIIDIDAAAKLILEFDDKPALAIIKHTNPCGAATAATLSEAFHKAYATDTASPFGGIIVVNKPVDKETAETVHSLFTELIIAPDFTEDALAILTKKRDRRLIRADYNLLSASIRYDVKSVAGGGFLVQTSDKSLFDVNNLKVVTKRHPTDDEMQSLLFGWKIAKHVKSNAIVFSAADRTLGIGAGQMSRVDSSRIAVEKAKMMGIDLKGSTLASDAYFPFADGVEYAAEAGATAVIQPGGSTRDAEVIEAADKAGMAMVFTGERHFRH